MRHEKFNHLFTDSQFTVHRSQNIYIKEYKYHTYHENEMDDHTHVFA